MQTIYYLFAAVALIYGNDFNDCQLFNMGFICMLDIICEEFIYILPSWYHRRMILIDTLVRI